MTATPPRFTELTDLASERLGGQALEASDDFFAPKENLTKAAAPIWTEDKYTEFGKWMDGWESRRKRNLGPGNDHDWCVLKLGAKGAIAGIDVDTSFFTGNFPEGCALDGANSAQGPWTELVARAKLQGGSHNFFDVKNDGAFTHVRLRIFPDGGVARLRVFGEVRPDWTALKSTGQAIDLASVLNGARALVCNDMFFSHKDNLILPGRARTMGEGWETKRKRGPGHDWIVVQLGAPGRVEKIEIDTNHYKGNYPESCSIEACASESNYRSDRWRALLPRVKLEAHKQHYYQGEIQSPGEPVAYLRLNIYPDGGISRLRVWGKPA